VTMCPQLTVAADGNSTWAYATIRPKSAMPDLDRENRQFVVNRRRLAVKFEFKKRAFQTRVGNIEDAWQAAFLHDFRRESKEAAL
jgi:hypothetical protein